MLKSQLIVGYFHFLNLKRCIILFKQFIAGFSMFLFLAKCREMAVNMSRYGKRKPAQTEPSFANKCPIERKAAVVDGDVREKDNEHGRAS